MNNNLYTQPIEYNSQRAYSNTRQTNIGGINKSAKIIRMRKANDAIEELFMNISFKANRADEQRNSRLAKRS